MLFGCYWNEFGLSLGCGSNIAMLLGCYWGVNVMLHGYCYYLAAMLLRRCCDVVATLDRLDVAASSSRDSASTGSG